MKSREELEALLKLYLENESARQAKIRELREFVLQRHTYEVRAEKLAEIIRIWQAEET